jgi:3-hydroxyisobutyrate dehydrogenase-like beta-hydroxyacid dehydrogenase
MSILHEKNNLTITIIGLGNMGLPIATNLVKAGFPVKAYNRNPEKTRELADLGAEIYPTPQQAVADADVVITMLSDDSAVTEVSEKILPAMKTGSIHLSMSTIAPATADALHLSHQQHNVRYVGSPVMGRPPAAAAKQLFILLSGEAAAKEKIKPVLDAISQRTFDFGDQPSAAHAVKVMLNFMIFTIVELLSEVMLLAEKSNIDKNILLETMTGTVFGAPVFKNYGALVVQEQDNPNGFATRLANKDLRLAQEAASKLAVQLPLADLIRDHFEEVIAAGGGQKDVSVLITHLRRKLIG